MRCLVTEQFLIRPIQRIPRYEMLLSELLKNTPECHADHIPVQSALKAIKLTATSVNDLAKEAEARHRWGATCDA